MTTSAMERAATVIQAAPDASVLHQILTALARATGARRITIEKQDPAGAGMMPVASFAAPVATGVVAFEDDAGPPVVLPLFIERRRVGRIVCDGVPHAVMLDQTQPGQLELLTTLAAAALRNMTLMRELETATADAVERRFRLLDGLVHYLKNTLGAAGEYVQLLEMEAELSPRQHGFITASQRNIDDAIRLLNELVDLNRVDTGRFTIEREPIDPAAIVRGLVRDYEMLNATSGVRFGCDLPHELPRLHTDINLMRRILDTLLSNAVKYTPPGGYVWVRADLRAGRRADDPEAWVCITVHDDGPGVKDREMVFEEVARAESNSSTPGFRLAISRRIARLLGGDLSLETREGGGSSFSLWLPPG